MAAYLGRSANAVAIRLQKLRSDGVDIPNAATGPGRSQPWVMPRNAVLLAKSCTSCGKLRDAAYYNQRKGGRYPGSYASDCRLCHNDRKRGSNKFGPYQQNAELLQEITFAQASNERKRYSEADLAEVKDTSRSEFDVALSLSRSYYAITSKRQKVGVGPWGKGAKRQNFPDAQWQIDFPAAMVAIQEHFQSLGQVVPESLWEWTDEQVAS